MKKVLTLLFFGLCAVQLVKAQVKIGNNPNIIDITSILELESTEKVLVITRVNTAQMNAITPLQGALVYNTDLESVHYYNGTQWVNIGGGGGGGGDLTADPIVNDISTIVITPTGTGNNLEVAENSIGTTQIRDLSINGTEDILDGSIGVGKFGEDVITQFELSENSVGPIELDNANIGVSAFNNDVGYITSASIVSIDADNALQIGTDDGAYYDETPLLDAIQDNADAIAADTDQSPSNEIQNLTLNGFIIGLTNTAGTINLEPLIPDGGTDDQNIGPLTFDDMTYDLTIGIEDGNPETINLGALAGGGGNPTDELTDISFNETTNVLSLSNPATLAGGTVDLSSLAGGGGNQNLGQVLTTGNDGGAALIKNIADPEDPQDAATRAYVDAAVTGGGSLNDGTILIGDATNAAQQVAVTGDASLANTGFLTINDNTVNSAKIMNATILAEDLNQMGATDGQVLKWNDATTSWVAAVDNTGTATLNDGNIYVGDATNSPQGVALTGDASIDNTGGLTINDDAITLNMIDQNGAINGQVLKWDDATTSWITAADDTGTATLDNGNIYVGDATNAPQGVALSGDATIDNTGALTIADDAITLEKIDQNGATADGDIIHWNATTNAWEVGANPGHTGDPKSVFFAGADGQPTQFFHPDTNRPSLYWDYEGRTLGGTSYGALAIGIDGDPQQGTLPELSNAVKVHIGEKLANNISYSLLLQNFWDTPGPTSGSGVGILFASDRFNEGKGSLLFERKDDWGVGDFHFLLNNSTMRQAPELATDKAFTITREKDIRLYGGIDINGVGFGTAGQVLASGGAGNPLQWVNAGSASVTDTDANDGLSDYSGTTGYNINVDDSTIEVASDDLQLKDGGITAAKIQPATPTAPTQVEQILVSSADGSSVSWQPMTAGSNNLATDDQVQDSGEDRTYDLNGNQLVFQGSGNIGIGDFGMATNPAAPYQKFHVLGEIRSQGFNSSFGTEDAPAFSFAAETTTTGDSDTGMWRDQADELAFSAGGVEGFRIEENSMNVNAIFAASMELESTLIDVNNQAGTAGQILSSTATGVDWIDAPEGPAYKAKLTTTETTLGTGLHTVTFPTPLANNQYIINLTVEEVTAASPIFISVTNQTAAGFTVRITELVTGSVNPVSNATWHYTVYNP